MTHTMNDDKNTPPAKPMPETHTDHKNVEPKNGTEEKKSS